MSDMLVKLYDLPDAAPYLARLRKIDVAMRQGAPTEKRVISDWVRDHFEESWAACCEVALGRFPISCYIAVETSPGNGIAEDPYALAPEVLVGFACYDADVKGMFGPLGVHEDYRRRGIGTALLLMCLHAMRAERYAYAIVGWAGPTGFYANTVGATIIEGSEPGVFRGPLIGLT
jgi:GNAT superfamily N-acetyltransferase